MLKELIANQTATPVNSHVYLGEHILIVHNVNQHRYKHETFATPHLHCPNYLILPSHLTFMDTNQATVLELTMQYSISNQPSRIFLPMFLELTAHTVDSIPGSAPYVSGSQACTNNGETASVVDTSASSSLRRSARFVSSPSALAKYRSSYTLFQDIGCLNQV